jgi:hypothetical protein
MNRKYIGSQFILNKPILSGNDDLFHLHILYLNEKKSDSYDEKLCKILANKTNNPLSIAGVIFVIFHKGMLDYMYIATLHDLKFNTSQVDSHSPILNFIPNIPHDDICSNDIYIDNNTNEITSKSKTTLPDVFDEIKNQVIEQRNDFRSVI